MNIVLLDSSDWPTAEANGVTKQDIEQAVTDASNEVSHVLELPEHLNMTIRPHESLYIIPETGEGGYTYDTELILLTFDPAIPHGKDALMKSIRETIFHESSHAYRWMDVKYDDSIVNGAVLEGLATVFADDYAGAHSPWGKYEGERMDEWLKELSTKTGADYRQYFFSHPDGRRWIGYKVGTWLVREAMKNSGKNVIELTRMEWHDLVELAGKSDLLND